MTSEETLSSDVASLVRVRNRLSSSPDNQQLPKILSALLPKLLTRLEASLSVQSYDSPRCKDLTLLAQEHINGILLHGLERLRGNPDLPSSSIISAVLPFLESKNSVLGTWALIYIQGGISRCTSDTLPADTVPTLIQSIDQLHAGINVLPCKTSLARLTSTSWMLLDCIMMSVGLKPLIDWDLDVFDGKASNWEIQSSDSWGSLVSERAISAAAIDGTGVFHLLLDLLLFWPNEPALHSGLSVDGESRLCHRSRIPEEEQLTIRAQRRGNRRFTAEDKWSDMAHSYLRQLKLVSLRYAIWPRKGGMFQQSNSDRALVLAVITACNNSMHGRLSADYINELSNKENLQKQAKGLFCVPSSKYSLNVAYVLLILMVGDQRANPLLQSFEKRCHRTPWTAILGTTPSQESRQRPPLPTAVSSRAVAFLLNNRLSLSDPDKNRDEVQLLVDLTGLLASRPEGDGSLRSSDERKYSKFWGVQLIHAFFEHLGLSPAVTNGEGDEWSSSRTTCLDVAVEVISIVVEVGESNVEQPRVANRQLPGGAEVPFPRRHDLNRMLNAHRASLKRRKLGADDAIRARQIAYEVIGTSAVHSISRESRPFELPVCLLRCSIYEDDYMQHYVSKANTALLDVYNQYIQAKEWGKLSGKTHVDGTESSLQQLAVPLLPALLDAVCSDGSSARLVAIEWIRRFLYVMDVEAAWYLLNFLEHDPDSQVSAAAKKASENIDSRPESKKYENISIVFLNRSTSEDIQELKSMLKACLLDVSNDLDITHDMAAVLLFDFKCSPTNVAASYRGSQQETLEKSGLVNYSSPDKTLPADLVCGICYDSIVARDEAYSVDCGHEFCRDCWMAYLETAGGDKKFGALEVRCPQQKCDSRVLPRHLQAISPRLRQDWDDTYFRAFLEMDQSCRACPGLNCPCVAVVEGRGTSSQPVSCTCIQCKASFCFRCGEGPHQPASCAAITEWTRIQAKSDFWVRKNSKPCPSCHAPIEKNQGCNHMTCTCGVQFCWLCLTQLSRHSENHTCNRYDPTDDANDDHERRALFVAERYDAHLQAEQFAESQYKTTKEKPEKLVEIFWFLTQEDEDRLNDALLTLCKARKFLRNSYVASFGLRDHPGLLETLENYQSALEMLTERLSQLTETNLQRFYLEKGEYGVKAHFHGLGFYTVSVSNYMDRFNAALWPSTLQLTSMTEKRREVIQ